MRRGSTASRVAVRVAGIVLALSATAAGALSAQPPPRQEGTQEAGTEAEPSDEEQEPTPRSEPESLDRSTPRKTVRGFLEAAREEEFRLASRYLELGGRGLEPGSSEAAELARQLHEVIEESMVLELATVSDRPEGDPGDGVRIERVRGDVQPERADPRLVLELRELETGESAWLVSASTVARIPELYAAIGHGLLAEVLPDYFFELRFLDLELWQWLGLLLAVVLASAAGYALASVAVGLAGRFTRRTSALWDDALVAMLSGPLRLLASVWIFWAGARVLDLVVAAGELVDATCEILTVLAVTWFLLRLIELGGDITLRRYSSRGPMASTVVPMGKRMTKILVLVIAVLSLVHNLGFNITSILAGLGVGGLAVALAAQKTLENLFGGLTVIADQPVKVGEFCRVGSDLGTVEDIGLRSTRLRTLDHTQLTIPNAEFSSARIENYSLRRKMRLYTVLQVGYETTPDQMRWLLVELRRMLHAHARTLPDPCRVRFVAFGAHSLDLEVFVYIDTADYSEFLAVREDIFLRILDIVAASGTYFAYPSQTLYLGRDAGRDEEKSRAAEEQVAAWREAGELAMPDLSPETVRELDDTLPYPPPGSVSARRP